MKEQSTEFRHRLLDIVRSKKDGIPKEQVRKQLESLYSTDIVAEGMRQAIDEFLIEQVVDYTRREGEVGGDFIWYVRALSREEEQKLRSLKPVQLALLKLMYEQESPGCPGEIRVADARDKLRERGYVKPENEYLRIVDKIEAFWTVEDDGRTELLRVIPEHEKTPQYKAAKEESDRELEDITAFHMKVLDVEEEEMDKRARARSKKKPKVP